eukprot:jgi/Galph1/4879/GphlegSOOS_G3554.1
MGVTYSSGLGNLQDFWKERRNRSTEVEVQLGALECGNCGAKSENEVMLKGGSDPLTDPLVLLRRYPSSFQAFHVSYKVQKSAIFPSSSSREGLLELKGRWIIIRKLPETLTSNKTLTNRRSSAESHQSSWDDSEASAVGAEASPSSRTDSFTKTDSLQIRLAFPIAQAKIMQSGSKTVKIKISNEISATDKTGKCSSVIMNSQDLIGADGALVLHGGKIYIRSPNASTLVYLLKQGAENPVASLKDYELLAPIGKGASGSVYFAKSKKGNEYCAIKIIPKSQVFPSCSTSKHLADERLLLQLAGSHPFILGLRAAFQTTENFYLVTEFCEGGDLFFYLQRHGRRIPENEAKRIAAEVLLGIEETQKNGFVYRDLKPENILLDKYGHVRLADFGLCRNISSLSNCRTNSFCGTRAFLSPEMLRCEYYGYSVDIWAFGTLLYDLLFGKLPFHNKNRSEMYRRIKTMPVPLPEDISENARALLNGLLEKNPFLRHPFFSDIDWVQLLQGCSNQSISEGSSAVTVEADNRGDSSDVHSFSESDKDIKYMLRNFDTKYLAKRSITPVADKDFAKKCSSSSSEDDGRQRTVFRPLNALLKPLFHRNDTRSSCRVLLGFEYDDYCNDFFLKTKSSTSCIERIESWSSSVGTSLSSSQGL